MKESSGQSAPTLRFLGAAGTVTGSRFLLTSQNRRVLVDCGLFQGLKELRLRNWSGLPIEPHTIEDVILTHAHLDHSGYIPAICRDGFRGRIFATPGSSALSRIVLPDSGHLQEEEAEYANKKGYSKHSPALPLYTEQDAWNAVEQFSNVPLGGTAEVGDVRVTFLEAGHILGASSLMVETAGANRRRILFSGDLGRPNHPILRAPSSPPAADVIVVESTYGDRVHNDEEGLATFEQALIRACKRSGVIVIPSFAVDRTEVVLFHLSRLKRAGKLPETLPIYVDSPMALAALHLYEEAIRTGASEIRPEVTGKPEILNPGGLVEIRTPEESRALNARSGPMIIIAASGMATGGRVLHHLVNRLGDQRNMVILVGYQAEGTRGRLLLEGAPSIKMLGRYVQVGAEIVDVPAFSVHADRNEILSWLKSAAKVPETVYVVHGDPDAAESLRKAIVAELRWHAIVPRHLEQVRVD